jgi:glycerol-3-phosphate dehydrogenase (NAD(P)+)
VSRPYASAAVIGAGAWGTALAQVCRRAGLATTLWAREPEVAEEVNSHRTNAMFLPGITLDEEITAVTGLASCAHADLILAVAPAQHTRAMLAHLAPHLRAGQPVVLCAKGIEQGTLKLMSEVLAEIAPCAATAVLSGPSFAGEVAKGLPTAVTLACPDEALGEALARAIATPSFRPYWIADVVGAEAGGAVKNVLAIACGIVEGAGLGRSAHAAVVTRGFAELTRLAVALGADPRTLAGLCGLGDLILTCSSSQSRNMSLGLALGRGESLEAALAGKLSVADGVASAPAVRALAQKLDVETPICEAVAAVLAGERNLGEAIGGLLLRPLRTEREE